MRCAFSLLPYNLRLGYALFPSHSTKYVLIRFMKNIIFIISPVGSLITCKKKTFSQKFKLRRCDRLSSVHNLNTATTFSFLYCILAVFFTHWPSLSRSQLIPNIAPKPTEENNNHNNRRRLLASFFQTINSFNRFRTVSIEWMYVVILKVHYCRILLTQSACLNDNIQMQRRKMYGIMIWEF